jgi:hypothetical protein
MWTRKIRRTRLYEEYEKWFYTKHEIFVLCLVRDNFESSFSFQLSILLLGEGTHTNGSVLV